MHIPYCYSPLDIADYRITSMPACEVSGMMKLPPDQATPVWNLAWLSLPSLDALPVHGKTPNWFKHYVPTAGASRAIIADAIADDVMFRKLVMHPSRFLAWFERENHGIYDCYEALGGDKWVMTVLERATLSAKRMAEELPESVRNNVYYAAFPEKGLQ